MTKKIVWTVILGILLIGFVLGGILLMGQTSKKEAFYEQSIAEAVAMQTEAQSAYDSVDTTEADAITAEIGSLESEKAALEGEIQTVTEANAQLDSRLADCQKEYDQRAQEEENAYFLTVYESLMEGMKKVEGYIGDSQ